MLQKRNKFLVSLDISEISTHNSFSRDIFVVSSEYLIILFVKNLPMGGFMIIVFAKISLIEKRIFML